MAFHIKDASDGLAVAIKSTTTAGTTDTTEETPHHNVDNLTIALPAAWVHGTGNTTGTGSTQAIAAVTSKSVNVCAVQVANKGATAVLVSLQDGSGGTVLGYIYCPAGQTISVQYPIPLKTSSGIGLFFQADGSTTTLYVSAQGYTT